MRSAFFLVTVFLASPRFAGAQQTLQVPLWDRINQALQAPNGSEYFRISMQGATIPGGAGGVVGLRGTVISRDPPDHPTILTISMSNDGIADVTLRLIDDPPTPDPEQAAESLPPRPFPSVIARRDIAVEDMIREWRERGLRTDWVSGPRKQSLAPQQASVMPAGEPAPGASVEFEGIAQEFSREPFMLTFDVSRSKITIVPEKR